MREIAFECREPFNYLRWYVQRRTDVGHPLRATIFGKEFYRIKLRMKIGGTADDFILGGVSCEGWSSYLVGLNYSTETIYKYYFEGDEDIFMKDMLMVKMIIPDDD